MKIKSLKKISSLMAAIMVLGIVLTGGMPQNNTVIQAIVSTLGTIGTKDLNISGSVKHVEEKAENPSTKLKGLLSKYDTGKPVSDKIDIKDDLKKVKDTYVISAKQFSEITGDKYSFSSTGNGLLIQHDGYSVALNPNDNLMVVNDDEYQYMPSPMTKVKNEYYFPVEDVAEGLGYSVTKDKDELTLSRDYQSKRLLVKTEGKLADTQDAIATAEVIDDVYALQYDSETKAEEACEYFSSLDSVDYAQPDAIVTAANEETAANSAVENDSSGTYYSWGAQAMGVDDYNNYLENTVGESNLKDVVIAVLDTGIDTDHPWFSGRIADNGTNYSTSVSSTAYEYEDVYGHGTHVSGIICDLTLNNVKILPVKVLSDKGYGYTSLIVEAINYVTRQKLNGQNIYAINLSLGGTATETSNAAFNEAIGNAYDAGILAVVAAGNSGADAKDFSPANTEKAITVAAVGQSTSGYYRTGWSNYGACVDLSAPGYKIESACVGGGTVYKSGTSMAAPHVAAAIALLYSNSLKSYTLPEIEDDLDYFSKDLGASGWDQFYGAGMVTLENAYAAHMDPVAFSKTTEECSEAFDLTLSCSEAGAQIYYTLDGSTPSASNGTSYTGSIHINASTKIKAVAYITNNHVVVKCSPVSSMMYYLGQDIENAFTVSSTGELTAYTGILVEVTIPSSVNGITVTSIGGGAFSSVLGRIAYVTLPPTVTEIKDNAFNGCASLIKVYAPSVTKIGTYAFCYCSSLKYVQDQYFPELLSIGKDAFLDCCSLQSVTLSKVTMIDDYAFCMAGTIAPDLKEITLPSVKTIGQQGFFNCTYLTAIEIPSAEIICTDAFRNCDIQNLNLPSVKYTGNFAFFVNKNLKSVDMPEAIIIGQSCFQDCCDLLTYVNLPKAEIIGLDAFRNCDALTEINLPSVELMCEMAFFSCNKLETVNAPKAKYVNYAAFGFCDSLKEVYLPSVISISIEAFKETPGLQKVTLSSCIEDISPAAFLHSNKSCVLYLFGGTPAEKFAIANGYTYVDMALDSDCFEYEIINNTEVYITGYTDKLPENSAIPSYIKGLPVTKICSNAFKNCSKAVTIIVSGLKEIEPFSFSGCSNLREIYLLNIETIGEKAFYYCTGLNSVEITSAKTVGDNAFYGCSSLLSVELGPNISNIGVNAFGYSADELIIPVFVITGYAGSAAESYAKSHDILFHPKYSPLSFYYNFYENNGRQEIYISYVNSYTTGHVIIPSSYDGYTVSKIGDSAFKGCCFITGVELPKTITTLGGSVFYECTALETINCGLITSFGTYTFYYCYSLRDINLQAAKTIGEYCFYVCCSLSDVQMPLVTSLGTHAFHGCTNMKTVTCPSLNELPINAFAFNDSMESFDLQNIKTIGDSAFRYCKSLKSVYAINVENFGAKIFDYCPDTLTLYGHKDSPAQVYAVSNSLNFVEVETHSCMATFNANGGNGGTSNALLYGTTLTPPIVTRNGYSFAGWYLDKAFTMAVTWPYIVGVADVTFYAKWDKPAISLGIKAGSTAIIDQSKHFICGLAEGTNENDFINNCVQVNGDGSLRITCYTDSFGTGTKVEITDNATGAVSATYYIIIYGDVDGDGYITSADYDKINMAASYQTAFDEDSAFQSAADLTQDGIVDSFDLNIVRAALHGIRPIDQNNPRE